MITARTNIRLTAILFKIILVLPFTKLRTKPIVNIRGIVPRQNINIDKAPLINEPVVRAYNSRLCKGPHGIKAFKRPIKKGLLSRLIFTFR